MYLIIARIYSMYPTSRYCYCKHAVVFESWIKTIEMSETLEFGLKLNRSPNTPLDFVNYGFSLKLNIICVVMKIEKVINTFKVGFVINIGELGEDDPLLQNAKQYFGLVKAPWYMTIALKEDEPDYSFKQVNISSGRTLDIITLKTGKTQDSSSGIGEVQLKQLSRKLELSNSNWHIAAGFHPLFCNQSLEGTQKESHVLHQMLLKHGMDVYLSGQSCAKKARIGGPYLTTTSQGLYPSKKMTNSFLLHRVSPLEFATYGVSFKGNIIHESTIRQRGREAM